MFWNQVFFVVCLLGLVAVPSSWSKSVMTFNQCDLMFTGRLKLLVHFIKGLAPLLTQCGPYGHRSRNAQCKDRGYAGACKTYGITSLDESCEFLPCAVKSDDNKYYVLLDDAPQEGTMCGPHHTCQNEKCVSVPSSLVPLDTIHDTPYKCGCRPEDMADYDSSDDDDSD